jgi:hypothetical protein
MFGASGLLYYFGNKSIPIDDITVCPVDAANPGQRTNPDEGEQTYTFTLSTMTQGGCGGGDGATNLIIVSDGQVCPGTPPTRSVERFASRWCPR